MGPPYGSRVKQSTDPPDYQPPINLISKSSGHLGLNLQRETLHFHSLVCSNWSQGAFNSTLIPTDLCSRSGMRFWVIPSGLWVNHASSYRAESALRSAVFPSARRNVKHVQRRTEGINKGRLCGNLQNQSSCLKCPQ